MNLKKNNLEYNLCIFLAVIINLGLFIFSETILSKILLLIAIVLLVIPNFSAKKRREKTRNEFFLFFFSCI